MRKVIILKGLPGSGKSTFARAWVDEKPTERVRINRDDIRRQLGPYWVPSREELVTQIEEYMLMIALNEEYDVVIDATNFKAQRFYEICKTYDNIEVETKFIDTPLEECIRRDLLRDESVGEKVIIGMYEKYLKK